MSRATSEAMTSASSNKIARRPFVKDLLARRDGALIVCGLGSPTWDTFAAGDSPEYLYSWGGMGLAVPTALGIALARPDRRVVCITGDGEVLMGIGALGVVADQAPANLGILVLDNERFGETGRQRGLTAGRTDITAVARGFGIGRTLTVTEQGAVGELAELLFKAPGPVLAVAKIALGEDPWALPEKDGATIAHRFREALGAASA
jgi:phosphonopyruvate decarboxylase